MKRTKIELVDVASQSNLSFALWKAARGKRHRPEVQEFLSNAQHQLNQLAQAILDEQAPSGRYHQFYIRDPKERLIHAACFSDRVLHHAIMNLAEPTFERTMIDHSYACRPNKGVHKAIQQVQHNLCRYPWVVKTDISGYFQNINHDILFRVLCRKFKGNDFLHLLERVIKSCPTMPDCGLPIGSLTSQYFANYYLDGADRFLQEHMDVRAYVRYMDDMLFWCETKEDAKHVLHEFQSYLLTSRQLTLKPDSEISPSRHGVNYCGYRVKQGAVLLNRRKKRRYQQLRLYWEQQWVDGKISSLELQRAYHSVHAITLHADSKAWRAKNLQLHPPIAIDV